ncbi:MAG: hypothetical protein AB1746_12135 [Candidatus Zixiibacteriota bacterium]
MTTQNDQNATDTAVPCDSYMEKDNTQTYPDEVKSSTADDVKVEPSYDLNAELINNERKDPFIFLINVVEEEKRLAIADLNRRLNLGK